MIELHLTLVIGALVEPTQCREEPHYFRFSKNIREYTEIKAKLRKAIEGHEAFRA